MKSLSLAAALTALLCPVVALAQPRELPAACRDKPVPTAITGEAYAIDGDTLAIAVQPHIRVWGIQAPELKDKTTGQETVAGMRARAHIEELLAPSRRQVRCTPTKWDRYCRLVAMCDTRFGGAAPYAEPADLGWSMLAAGQAYGFYLDDAVAGQPELSRNYAAAESMARAQRRGLWKDWLGEK